MSETETILGIYRANSAALATRYGQVTAADVYAPVHAYLPDAPVRIADIGAGTGRDAVWFAGQGHDVTAVEPVSELAGTAPVTAGLTWIADTLPALPVLSARPGRFDLITVNALWHHLSHGAQSRAMATLAALLRPRGRLIISLRNGPGVDHTAIFPTDTDIVTASAARASLGRSATISAPAIHPAERDAGIGWTWAIFEKRDT